MDKRLFLCLLLLTRFAVAQDAPPVDAKALIAALKQIEEKHAVSAKQLLEKTIQDINAAASSNSSAIALYQEAIRATTFMGQSRENTQFMEWKKKEADELKSSEMQTAVRMHLTYLVLSLHRANGATIPQLLPALLSYTAQVTAARDLVGRQEMMKRNITDSLFVRWYGISKLLKDLKAWETSPGDVDGIYQKSILPQMRADKNPRILDYWDAKIQQESTDAKDSKRAFNAEQFDQVRRPELLWSRAQDLLAIGLRNRAITEMFAVVKSFPEHPNNSGWNKELMALLTNPEPATTAPGG